MLVDRQARVVWINDQYRRYLPALGFDREEDFVGHPVSAVVQNTLMHQVLAAQGDARLFHTDFSACNAYTGGLAAADAVRCPATLVLGQADQMTLPRGAREVAQRLKGQVHTLAAGHHLMAEAPDAALAALRAALA
jgi:pimeloyl-ACP methyl ester carboxylesterase